VPQRPDAEWPRALEAKVYRLQVLLREACERLDRCVAGDCDSEEAAKLVLRLRREGLGPHDAT
jgi:hypothetical protein